MASINDLMYEFYQKFAAKGDKLPVEVDGEINIDQVNVGAVQQGKKAPDAEPWEFRLVGSSMDLRGSASNRPAANAVPAGTTYWSIDTGDVSVSDGTDWRSLGVV